VFSKDKLFRKLWDEDDFDDINTVAVHLQKLRKRLLKSKYIETLWDSVVVIALI